MTAPLRAITRISALLVTLTLPAAAAASIGAGVGAIPIVPVAQVHPGASTRFNDLYVVNTGSVRSAYRITVSRITHGSERPVPAGWVDIQHTTLLLAAKQAVWVPVALHVPAGAPPGAYMTNLVATTISAHARGGTAFGAAAAAKLTFTIPGAGGLSLPGWLLPLGAVVAAAVVAALAVKRLGLRLLGSSALRRKRSGARFDGGLAVLRRCLGSL